jgi:glucose-1-phosphate adenylyltransferase
MLKNYMGIVNLTENDANIKSLAHKRSLASIPMAGRYRIIDFVLSNMVNSGIQKVGIFTQSNSRSLMDHLGSGKPWDLDRKINGLFVFNFGKTDSYFNDVEAFKNNMEYFYNSDQENIILSPSYMVCNINYEDAVKCHEESGSDITVIYKKVDNGTKSFLECDILNIDENNRVTSVGKNMAIEDEHNISMEMFIMKKEIFLKLIYKAVETGLYKTIKDAIYNSVKELYINTYKFDGYLECINSIDSYYKANMDMLDLKTTKELFFNNGLIYTKVKDEAPTKYSEECNVSNCLIANGSIIEGEVENSIISRRVKIQKGAQVRNCIIMQNCVIGENTKLTNIIIDKNVTIESGTELKGDKEFPLIIEKKAIF